MASSAIPSPPESPLSSVDLKLLDGTQSSDQDVQRGHALIAPSKHLNTTQIDTVSHDQLVDLTTSIEAKAGAETLPVQALSLRQVMYKILPPRDINIRVDNWEFQPGTTIRISETMEDGKQVFTARDRNS